MYALFHMHNQLKSAITDCGNNIKILQNLLIEKHLRHWIKSPSTCRHTHAYIAEPPRIVRLSTSVNPGQGELAELHTCSRTVLRRRFETHRPHAVWKHKTTGFQICAQPSGKIGTSKRSSTKWLGTKSNSCHAKVGTEENRRRVKAEQNNKQIDKAI